MTAESVAQLSNSYKNLIVQSDDFMIGHVVGSGLFSQVVGARNKKTNNPCAIKRFFEDADPDLEKTFVNEVSIMASMDNPFIVKVRGFTVKKPFDIVMDYYGKGSLFVKLNEEKPEEISGTLRTIIAIGVASAMKSLHSKNIIHCDLNSANILLSDTFTPILIDFGISQVAEKAKNQDFGSPEWLAPEVLAGKPPTFKSDVYSFGTLLWNLLTNQYPFKGVNKTKIFIDVIKHHVKPKLPPDVPKGIAELIRSCLHYDPEQRPSFNEIYAKLSSGRAEFPDTKRDEVCRFMQENGQQIEMPQFVRRRKANKEINTQSFSIKDLPAPTSKAYGASISRVAATLNPEDADQFFKAIAPVFDHHDDCVMKVLTACNALFVSDKAFVEAFIKSGLISKLDFSNRESLEATCETVLHVMLVDPSKITKDMLKSFTDLIQDYPKHVLRLFNIYTCHIPKLEHFDYAVSLVMDNFPQFGNRGESVGIVSLVYTLCSINQSFKQKYIDKIIEYLSQTIIKKKVESAKLAYEFITAEAPETLIDQAVIEEQILEDNLQETILGYLASCKKFVITSTVAQFLLKLAEADQNASAAVLVLCENQENAAIFANLCDEWLGKKLPTLESQLQIGLSILKYKEFRNRIYANSQQFLEFMKQLLEISLPSVPQLITALDLPAPVLAQLADNGYFTAYFETVSKSGVSKNACAALNLLEKIAQDFFHIDLLGAMQLIEALIKTQNEGWAPYVLSALVTLATIPELAHTLKESGFPQRIRGWGILQPCTTLYDSLRVLLQ